MYFLLFIIGLELNIKEIVKQGWFISNLSFWIVLSESVLGMLFMHYIFGVSWGVSVLTATSFATVGEAILIPILDEFKIVRTKFGQVLLGIGALDDVVELVTIIAASILMGTSLGHSGYSLSTNFLYIALLFVIPFSLQLYQSKIPHLRFKRIPSLFLAGLVVLFAFVGVGSLVDSAALGALFAGISLRNLLSEYKIIRFEKIMRILAYGFFVPIFFLYVGVEVDLKYLFTVPLLIVLLLLITNTTKIFVSYLLARKKLGKRKSILLGIGLSAKFSTSIVIITMLYGRGIISIELYSVLIGSMILSEFIIPVLFSLLLKKWNLNFRTIKSN